ncbi:MAG TPA: substrate-binding domain-containing protein, partial [Allocoleopsis sp.]
MSQKNETTALILALLITAALLAGGFWWFSRSAGLNLFKSSQDNAGDNPLTTGTSPANSSSSAQANTPTFAQLSNVPSGLFSYGGSTSWAPIRKGVDSAITAAQPQFQLRYVNPPTGAPSSSTGIKMLLDGQLSFAQSSRPILDQEYNQAQQRGFKLQQISVAIDGLAVAVNPTLTI